MSTSSFNFAANVSMMFQEYKTIAERIVQAKKVGFKGVEITAPYIEDKENIAKALSETGLHCVLINSCPGSGNELLATKPEKSEEFKEKLELSISYAKTLNCSRIHLLGGCVDPQLTAQQLRDTYVKNMTFAADRLAQENITGQIECINTSQTIPGYFVDTPEKALELIKEINRPNITFQLDIFHLQIVKGNLTSNVRKLLPYTGYIQVSQVPDRSEPDSPGEINYIYMFDLLKQLKYTGWIGAEYQPSGDTVKGLTWFKDYK